MGKRTPAGAQSSTPRNDSAGWAALSQSMTEAQKWHLRFLAALVGEVADENLTRTEAAKRINDLQARGRRGEEKY